ncbi:GIN domain-containing protein [Georgenia sp. AZ-5]|uniref:GIN domain-containing protein n=1 Tax=Georgenia sp. AZ-5 TaxID=3367526 RepID=UPI003754F3C3
MNLRTLAALTLVVAPPALLAGCGTVVGGPPGASVSEEREVGDGVRVVSLDGVGDVRLSTGDEPSLRLTAGENVIERVITDVRGDVLVLDLDGPMWGFPGDITYDLVLPEVEELRVDGAGSVDADLSPGESLTVDLDGAGDLNASGVDVADLTVSVDGAGSVALDGRAERQTVSIDGVGEYSGENLVSIDADVTIGGAGSARVHATGTLRAAVDGAGEIVHTGGAGVTSEVSGAGEVREG